MWPSALLLARYAEQRALEQPGCWAVRAPPPPCSPRLPARHRRASERARRLRLCRAQRVAVRRACRIRVRVAWVHWTRLARGGRASGWWSWGAGAASWAWCSPGWARTRCSQTWPRPRRALAPRPRVSTPHSAGAGRFGLALSRRGGASGLAHAPGDLTSHPAAQAEGRACPLHALHVRHGRRRRLLAQSETTSIMSALLQGVSLQPGHLT